METRQIIILAIVIPLFLLFLWCLYWNQKRMRKRWKDSEEALKPFQDKCRDAITLKDVNNVWKDMDKLNYKDMHREEREKWMRYKAYLKGKYNILNKENDGEEST